MNKNYYNLEDIIRFMNNDTEKSAELRIELGKLYEGKRKVESIVTKKVLKYEKKARK